MIQSKMEVTVRKCTHCGKLMDEGFVINNGAAYYCSKECLDAEVGWEEYEKMYEADDSENYWTSWQDECCILDQDGQTVELSVLVGQQRYTKADCFVKFKNAENDPPEKVTIALVSQEKLGYKDNSPEDNEIFFYCRNPEQFVEMLAFGKNTEDWYIISVLSVR